MKHPIPEAALQQHIAVLGKNGSGKTYAAKSVIVEPLLAADKRVAIVDPTSAWWGLRSSADGKGPGFKVLVLGGDHGDLPLPVLGGAAVARLCVEQRVNLIADTGNLTVGERTRWMIDFAGTLYRLNRSPLHLVIDEAHVFAPQGKVPDPDTGRMLHAVNQIAAGGRSRGIRLTMLTQRPQKLHKDTLTTADTLIAMRVLAPQDREAVKAWIDGCGNPAQGKEVLDSLAQLLRGEGWVWYPEGGLLARMKFPAITTFDSSATPKDGDATPAPKGAAEIDLAEIRAALADAAAEAEANDPKALRARIAELERELRKTRPAVDVQALENARTDGYNEGNRRGMAAAATLAAGRLGALIADLVEFHSSLQAKADEEPAVRDHALLTVASISRQSTDPLPQMPSQPEPKRFAVRGAPVRDSARATVGRLNGSGSTDIPKGERAVLIALAQHRDGCARDQLTVLTGYKRSTRDAYIQRLRERGYAEIDGEQIVATKEGIAALGSDYDPLPTGSALLEHWMGRLPDGEATILNLIVAKYPRAADRDWLTEKSGYKRSTRDAYIQRLRSRRLVDGRDVVASADLFD